MPRVLNYKRDGLPLGAEYIGRAMPSYGLPGSKWANRTVKLRRNASAEERAEAIRQYEAQLLARPDMMASLAELRGKDLVCWCAPLACHGDVLLRLANAAPDE